MTFHVGQKIVCVTDTYTDSGWMFVPNKPKKGSVYTVRGITEMGRKNRIHLEEIISPVQQWAEGFYEVGFLPFRFRPVQERKTSIEIFTAMLNSQTRKENA